MEIPSLLGSWSTDGGGSHHLRPRTAGSSTGPKNWILILEYFLLSVSIYVKRKLNSVRFAHNWNDGTVEYWNNGYGSRHHLAKYDASWAK